MATKQELMDALKAADKAGNQEDARKIAAIIQRQSNQGAQPAAKAEEGGRGIMAELNRGIVNTFGGAVDLTASIMDRVRSEVAGSQKAVSKMTGIGDIPVVEGRNFADSPTFGGTESMGRGMAAIGSPVAEGAPEGFGAQMARGTGEALGVMLPAAGLAQKLQAAKGVAGMLARPFNQAVVKAPVASTAIEALSGAGMGAGREIAEINEFGPAGTITAEMIGGMSPVGLAMSPTRLTLQGGKKVAGLGKAGLVPFTKAGAEPRAARRLQELATDVDDAVRSININEGAPLSPAAKTGQGGLLELEDAVLRGDPSRRQQMSQKTSDSIQELRQSIEGESNLAPVKKVMEQRKKRALASLNARTEQAADDAARAISELGDVSAEDATLLVRDRLTKALDEARIEESRLWSRIPEKAKAPVSNTVRKYNELNSALARAQRDDMPNSARDVIGQMKKLRASGATVKKTTIKELDGLYKKLGEEATQARAAKEFNRARIAEELRESILDDIARADGGPAIQESIQTARAFSRELNDKFRKGPTGKILGFGREGGPAIDPSLGLERTIGAQGQTGELGRRAIARATQGDPTAMEGMQNYIKARFLKKTMKDGEIGSTEARNFIRDNKELLDAFPGLRGQLVAARSTADVSRRVTKRADFFRKALDKPAVSDTAKILNAPVDTEIAKIFSPTSDTEELMASVMRSVRKDKSGKALEGMKSGVGQFLIKSAEMPSMADESGRAFLNGIKMQGLIKKNEAALKKVYSGVEMARLKYMAELLAKFQKQRMTNREKIQVIQDAPGWMLDKVAAIGGAMLGRRIGSAAGSSTIQTPGIVSNAMKKMLNKLTKDKAQQMLSDAITDEKLFKQLLEFKPKAKGAAATKQDKTLRAWMAGPGARLFQDDEEEE